MGATLVARVAVAWALLGGVAAAGCTFGRPPAVVETAETFQAHPSTPRSRFVEWVADALADVQLTGVRFTEEQRAQLAARARALEVRHKPEHDARAALAEQMARALEEGNVQADGFEEASHTLAAAVDDAATDDAEALLGLHRLLTPAQRDGFVAAAKKRIDAHPGDIWNTRTKYLLWRQELQLSEEQQGRIFMRLGFDEASLRELAAESERRRAFLHEVLEAFTRPDLDEASLRAVLARGEAPGTLSTRRSRRLAEYLAAAGPILTAEQRQRAANLLRTRTGGEPWVPTER